MNAKTTLQFAPLMLLVSMFAAVGAFAQSAPASLASADSAFEKGRHDEALALYDKVLESEPGNIQALVRSGMLLSWKGQYTAAIERYDRALAVNPENYKAQMERAKVLSWSRRFEESQTAFGAILQAKPDDRDARLGLARVYSWGGNQNRAREEYMKVLDSGREDADALLGIAQTFAWSGDSVTALEWYERALRAEPGKQGALIGRAYIDLWTNARPRAIEAAAELESKSPGNSDVAALRRTIDDTMSFWFRASYDSLEDTDDNQLDTYRVEVGDAISPRVDYRVGFAQSDMSSLTGEATISRAYGAMAFLPGGNNRVELRLGSDRTEGSTGDSDSEVVGGANWNFGTGTRLSGTVGLNRETMIYSPKIADNRIGYDAISSAVTWKFNPTLAAEVRGSVWSLTDYNDRAGYDGTLRWTPRTRQVTWLVGAGYRSFSYDENFDNGYFDPQDYFTYFALLGARGRFGSSAATWDFASEIGLQTFTLGGIETRDDQNLSGILTLGFPVSKWVTFEVYAAHSDSAVQTATGFESDQYGARLRIQRRQ